MRAAIGLFFLALAIYSAVLLAVEWHTSQDFVRQYFTDIEGDVPFFAVNTTLSTFLLTGAAILLLFAACAGRRDGPAVAVWFLVTQAAMLAFLAFDDRFQLHEAIAYRVDIADHYVMALWAAIEVALLLGLTRLSFVPVRSAAFFVAGCTCFAVMMVFDALVPHDMVLRLSIEDLAKSWAAALFFAAAWFVARFHLGLDPDARTLGELRERHRKHRLREDLSPAG